MPATTSTTDRRAHVVVTGASSGIGRAAAIELARRGYQRLTLVARRAEQLKQSADEAREAAVLPLDITEHSCDLTDREQVEHLIASLAAGADPVGALINNAGVGSTEAFESPDGSAALDQLIELNLRAPIRLTQALLPSLAASTRGVVVNVSSVAGLVGTSRSPVYSATKWGLTGFSEALRARAHGAGVRVVCVQPGPVPTPGWPHLWLDRHRVARRLIATDVDTIAQAIADGVDGIGSRAPVRPRIYGLIPTLRGIAPGILNMLLQRGATR